MASHDEQMIFEGGTVIDNNNERFPITQAQALRSMGLDPSMPSFSAMELGQNLLGHAINYEPTSASAKKLETMNNELKQRVAELETQLQTNISQPGGSD